MNVKKIEKKKSFIVDFFRETRLALKMKIDYEGVSFLISKKNSVERHIVKQRIKKAMGALIGKPYEKDAFLCLAEKILHTTPKAVVVDIGANIGTTTLPLAKKFPKANFFAVEPHPLPASRFIQNCMNSGLPNVFFLNAAISPKSEIMKIFTCSANSGGHRVTGFEGRQDIKKMAALDHISVPSLSLKAFFSHFNISYCHLLKIDVEGFECQVLESLEDDLSPKKIGSIVAEYGPEGLKSAGKTGWDLVNLLLKKGFKCQELKTQKPIQSEQDIPSLTEFAVTDFMFTA